MSNITTFNATGTGRTGTIQQWVVPANGKYRITAHGAEGGNSVSIGGKGAMVSGIVELTAGQTLNILVGQAGMATVGSSPGASGGGGTFVVLGSNTLLFAAGGGGGGSYRNTAAGDPGRPGVTTTNGTNGNTSVIGSGSVGGSGGNGGSAGTDGGGGGWSGTGSNGSNGPSTGGQSYAAGGLGGQNNNASYTSNGGFGGGAGAQHGGGGGGGYSGGGGGSSNYGGGGGGSFLYASATETTSASGTRSGHGLVEIESFPITATTDLQTSSGNVQAILAEDLAENTMYQVRARTLDEEGNWSNWSSMTSLPLTPTFIADVETDLLASGSTFEGTLPETLEGETTYLVRARIIDEYGIAGEPTSLIEFTTPKFYGYVESALGANPRLDEVEFSGDLIPGKIYHVRARIIDEVNAEGPWSELVEFMIYSGSIYVGENLVTKAYKGENQIFFMYLGSGVGFPLDS